MTDFETSILDWGLARLQGEIDSLPGEYAPPGGALFLAFSDGRAVGCVGLRRHAADVAELKRLFVRPSARAAGVGRRLTLAVLRKARRIAYRSVVLDTLPRMTTAAELYRRIGFRPTPAYWPHPVPNALFFRFDVRAVGSRNAVPGPHRRARASGGLRTAATEG
ncbi:MAG: GNAT family N-acetyltransferase [Thermoplasmata archaeon]|nr:GNAT family N-acetyltransferase [Thermoplasmata archaeon]